MTINIKELPEWAKLEVKKADLQAFAEAIMKEVSSISSQQSESNQDEEEDEILDFIEMRQYLKLAQSTAYQKVNNGEIPHYKKGRRLYFKKKELRAYLDSGRRRTNKDLEAAAQEYLRKSKIR
jgi:excisionase family DNA binding protein